MLRVFILTLSALWFSGCASVALLNVAAGVQVYVLPAVVAFPNVTLPDPQMF